RHACAGAVLHAARLRHRHHRRSWFDGRCARGRCADRHDRGAGRASVHTVSQEHVRFRDPGPGAAVPAAGHPRQAAVMRALLLDGVSRQVWIALGVALAAFLIAPLIVNDYLLTVLILILYFAFTAQTWNIMMGFAGQLSLGHALYVGLGAYTTAALYVHFGISPWLGLPVAVVLSALVGPCIAFLAFRFP